jgi:tetratricopeptide (TPR) repeat protein
MTPLERALFRARIAMEQGDGAAIILHADEALQHDPMCHEALFMAATALLRGEKRGLALQLLMIATRLKPDVAAIWNNLGMAWETIDDGEAYKAFRRAVDLRPDMVEAVQNMCSAAITRGRYEESLAWGEKALALEPSNMEARYNMALAMLSLGRWDEAWPLYALSLGHKARHPRNYHHDGATPRWAGPPHNPPAPVVIYGEQGIGDEVMYASMLNQAIVGIDEPIIETDPRLEGLFARSFPKAKVFGTRRERICEWIATERPGYRIEMAGLGEYFAKESFRSSAYLQVDNVREEMALAWLDQAVRTGNQSAQTCVGIAWTAGVWETGRRRRSVPLEALLPLLKTPDVTWVCLEYEDPRYNLAWLREQGVTIHDPRSMVRKEADYDDTAGLLAALDLVIAPTTSVVDLAGALGVECWALVPKVAPWRYGVDGDEMFWYESVRVFRQREEGQWGAPVHRVMRALAERLGASSCQKPPE